MNNELIIIISVILIGFAWIWYKEKRREKKEKLSRRIERGY